MGNSPNQCNPSDRDRDLACCWLKKKCLIFPDFTCVFIPVKHARVLGGILGMVTSRPGV